VNPIIKEQLDKLQYIQTTVYDEDTTIIHIPKRDSRSSIVIKQDECYLICLEDYILNPPDGFTLHTNWNNNKIPKHKYLIIDVSKIMGNMIKVNSIGYDIDRKVNINDVWEGWLPDESFVVIERL
jgi:hypothetical protein